jgi:hypothetical protein
MSKLHIEDITITYQGHDLSQYGLFPLLAWYLMDVIKLPEYFAQVTVNKKRDKKKSSTFSDSQMCMGTGKTAGITKVFRPIHST